MSNDDTSTDPQAISIDRYPDPVVSYASVDDGLELRATNDAFDSVFGTATAGTPLAEVFDRFEIRASDAERDVIGLLERDEQFLARLETTADGYLARGVPPGDGASGYLLFVTREDVSSEPGAQGLGIDRVASVISHDLRNPLDVAKARLRTGRETGNDEHFDHVERAHDRMERIIQDVLTLARGEESIAPEETVDLEAVAEAAWCSVETDTGTLDIDGELPTTVADCDRAERLFENLFRNAVEHGSTSPDSGARQDAVEHGSERPDSRAHDGATEQKTQTSESDADDVSEADGPPNGETEDDSVDRAGSPTVTVGRLEDTPAGFYVADDGPGIPPDERSAVFEPGYSSREHGTGLGLAIVERIAEAHGWTVTISSADGGGTRVEIRDVKGASER